jgi:Ni,Fe-hydrogenase I small subunit
MNKYTATDSKGQLFKRGSKNRTYTHCVVAEWSNGEVESSWAGSPTLAAAKYGYVWKNEIIRVEILEAKEA